MAATIGHLVQFIGHDDAKRITADDVIRWKDSLLAARGLSGKPVAARTVQTGYLSALRTVLQWGVENRKVAANVASEVRVRIPRQQQLRDRGFTDVEAKQLLAATLKREASGIADEYALAIRWLPWLCAYSGARAGEIGQLRAEDVRKEGGQWVLHITPEAGPVKTDVARTVPLHSHLVDMGFPDVAKTKGSGPLFYNPARQRGPKPSGRLQKRPGERVARFVREIGLTDVAQPNHAWRHRFKTEARRWGMDGDAMDFIQGHAPATVGKAYGTWTLDRLAIEIEKLPRYDVSGA